jgi:two-component system, NtrC family, sensor kinase
MPQLFYLFLLTSWVRLMGKLKPYYLFLINGILSWLLNDGKLMPNLKNLQLLRLIKSTQERSSQSWRTRNLALFLIIGGITSLVSVTAVLSYLIVRGLILDNLKENTLLKVQHESQQIDRWLSNRKTELKTLAHTPSVRSMDWSIVAPYLKLELQRIQEFSGFVLAEPDGSYYTTQVGRTNLNLKDRKHFQKGIAGETYIADPAISRSTKVTLVPIATPIFADGLLTGKPIGTLIGSISIEQLTQVVSGLKYGEGSYAFALNSEGVPIVHPDQTLMGNVDNTAPSFLQAKDPTLAKLARQMIDQKSNIELMQIDGKWVYVPYVSFKETDWSIALVIPRSQLEKELNALNLLATVLGILLGVAMLAAITRVKIFEQTRVRAETEALLNRLTKRIRASLNLDEILETTVEELGNILHLERISFAWYNSQEKTLEISSEYCSNGLQKQLGFFCLESEGDLATLLEQGESLKLLPTNSHSSNLLETKYLELKNPDYLAFAIFINSDRQGYLLASATRKLVREDESQLLQAVADQLAIAITQSHLYSQTQAQVKLLDEALRELKRTQSRLVQSEKMSSLGQLVAGIAHEINNPISFIYGNISHANDYITELINIIELYNQYYPQPLLQIQEEIERIDLEFIIEDLPQILNSMKQGADRIRLIVLSLRNFSRLDEEDKKEVNIHEGIDNTLMLLQNRLEDKISIVKHYSDLPLIDCYAGQLNQVFMNLITNAIDALSGWEISEKIISIKTGLLEKNQRQFVAITITDNGPGIPPEILPKIFDPFFTTKPVGKGTGMGLAISYQIVTEVHGGTISINTPSSGGVEALVEIPISSN